MSVGELGSVDMAGLLSFAPCFRETKMGFTLLLQLLGVIVVASKKKMNYYTNTGGEKERVSTTEGQRRRGEKRRKMVGVVISPSGMINPQGRGNHNCGFSITPGMKLLAMNSSGVHSGVPNAHRNGGGIGIFITEISTTRGVLLLPHEFLPLPSFCCFRIGAAVVFFLLPIPSRCCPYLLAAIAAAVFFRNRFYSWSLRSFYQWNGGLVCGII